MVTEPSHEANTGLKRLLAGFLTKLLKNAQRKHRDLKACIERELNRLKEMDENQVRSADSFFEPFHLGCRSQHQKTMEVSLEALQKLLALGYFNGGLSVSTNTTSPITLADLIIETICEAGSFPSDIVQLCVIKTLLTIVSTDCLEFHDSSLKLIVRCCYQISITTSNTDNAATALMTLTSLVSEIFGKMEKSASELKMLEDVRLNLNDKVDKDEEEIEISVERREEEEVEEIVPLETATSEKSPSIGGADLPGDAMKRLVINDVMDTLICKICVKEAEALAAKTKGSQLYETQKYDEALEMYEEAVRLDPTKAVHYLRVSSVYFVQEKWEECMDVCLKAVEISDRFCGDEKWKARAYNQYGQCAWKAGKLALAVEYLGKSLEIEDNEVVRKNLGIMQSQLKAEEARERARIIAEDPAEKLKFTFATLQHDAFVLFQEICTCASISVAKGPNSALLNMLKVGGIVKSEQDRTNRCRILSLQLLQTCLNNAGPTFCNSNRFIEGIRDFLMPVVYNNSISTDKSIYELTMLVFKSVVKNFRRHLHKELGQVLANLLLPLTVSGNSTFIQKSITLEMISSIADDEELIVSLFLNYDCDESVPDLISDIVSTLEKINQAKFEDTPDWITADEAKQLRQSAMGSLVKLLQSLLRWSERPYVEEDASATEDEDLKSTQGDAPSVISSTSEVVAKYQQVQQRRQILEKGILKFNMNQKIGMRFLVAQQLLEMDADAIADFFELHAEQLDKTQLGEFLGGDKDIHKETMSVFINRMEFTASEFDIALRHLCTVFRLPGEAQKIDRIMETFASRYDLQNPGVFGCADIAYTLAYSIIMLNTDLHSDRIKVKMTKEEFLKSNRRLSVKTEDELSDEFLSGIYDRIKKNEIKLMGESEESGSQRARGAKQRKRFFEKESAYLIENVRLKITDQKIEKDNRKYYESERGDMEAVLMMYQHIWLAALAQFSLCLEESDGETEVMQLCLIGYVCGIQLACRLNLPTECEAWVHSLKNFTLLGTSKTMRQKNIDSIKALLNVAVNYGNGLGDSWKHILECISEFAYLHSMSSHAVSNVQLLATEEARKGILRQMMDTGKRRKKGKSKENLAERHVVDDGLIRLKPDQNAMAVAMQIEESMVDRIFTQSTRLDDQAIVHFVTHLCRVSLKELDSEENPRVFSLQKIVEIAHYNMGRIRVVWSKMWFFLAEHFLHSGCHPNANISMYAIDSMRQLAEKFLDKDELSNFHFQKQFLHPFREIMLKTSSLEIRELIMQCMERMIKNRFEQIRSGWATVFGVFRIAATQESETLVTMTFDIMIEILERYFPPIQGDSEPPKSLPRSDALPECIYCLVELTQNRFEEISMKCIAYIETLANILHDDRLIVPISSELAPNVSAEKLQKRIWLVCLKGLAKLLWDPREVVRKLAYSKLFENILQKQSALFDAWVWRRVFYDLLMKVFDPLVVTPKDQGKRDPVESFAIDSVPDSPHMRLNDDEKLAPEVKAKWIQESCYTMLTAISALLEQNFAVTEFLFEDFMNLLAQFMRSENKSLIMISSKVFEESLQKLHKELQPEHWANIVDVYAKSIALSRPKPLYYNPESSTFDTSSLTQDELHLHFLDHSHRIISQFCSCLRVAEIKRIFDEITLTLQLSQQFSRIQNNPNPTLYFAHEQRSALRLVEVLALFYEDSRPDFDAFGVEHFPSFCKQLCDDHLAHEEQRRGKLLEPAICACLSTLLKLPPEQFTLHFHELFPPLCTLIGSQSNQIRMQLQQLFQDRIPVLIKNS